MCLIFLIRKKICRTFLEMTREFCNFHMVKHKGQDQRA